MGSLAEVWATVLPLMNCGNNASSTQKTWKSPVVRSPERCHADAPSKEGLVSQQLAPSGFASAAESCLAQHLLPRMATSNDWQWRGDHSPAMSAHSYPMQDISNWLELCQAWVAIWLLFLSNPPSSAFLPWVRIANHSLASQTLSGHLNCDTYVPGKASSWLPSMEGHMIRTHPGYPEKTLGLPMGKANSASQLFPCHDLQESILFGQLIEGNEGSCLGWEDWFRVYNLSYRLRVSL